MLDPATTVPVWPKPIVESTLMIEDPTDTVSRTLEAPGIVNVPSIRSLSLYPIKRPIL